ncbi:MerR family transcriptional regulator [Bacillus cytotoxicus]|uniref:MerR family transcriptional regulator n=1 Tax=Bacillus cytotoxicus TaxID=580165 RepID=A0ACC6A4D8_9BACI|nr:MerR family transcriptional regulator [Bacillus cytotoxicus]
MEMISIQQLTKETGVTVRTLRYYDQIGLLEPSGKTEGGHRLYSEPDVLKLQQILFFKEMGFALKEITNMLETERVNFKEVLQKQLLFVREEQQKLSSIEKMMQAVLHSTELEGDLNWDIMFELMQLSQQSPRMRQQFQQQVFSQEEEHLLKNFPNMSEQNAEVQEWILLLKRMRQFMQKKKAPSDAEVQGITGIILEKCKEMANGDEAFLDKLWEVRKSKDESKRMNMYPIEEELLQYMDEAFELYIEGVEKE